MHLHGLAGLDVGLHDLADRLVLWPRRTPAADAAVRVQPEITAADGEPAGVVRFGLYFVQHFSRVPIDLENLLGNLIANPQTVGRCFERVRVTVWRFEQPLDLALARRHRRRLAARAPFLRAHQASRGNSCDQRRRCADEFTAWDLHHLLPLQAELKHKLQSELENPRIARAWIGARDPAERRLIVNGCVGMSKLTMLKLLKWKFFDTAMSQICSDGP